MLTQLKDFIIGPALSTQALAHRRLTKIKALAAFSPDALSSIAYANQEIFLGLVIAGSAGLSYALPIGVAITCLLAILALSYYQTIFAYPSGGGSYAVAKSNLGTLPGLVAASALLIDYLLNSAVSLTAGVAALASAFPDLWPYRVQIALFLLLIITLVNLRGLQESGTVMAIPVYFFLASYFLMIIYGLAKLVITGPTPLTNVPIQVLQPVTVFLILHAFSTGSTALTGVEAISNGVPSFNKPESHNAGKTLIVMAVLMGTLFIGTIGLTQSFAVVADSSETILSALARYLFGSNFFYYVIQFSTLGILVVAANTSFAGFPRLAAILSQDGFLPHQLSSLGDRLAFTNGIVFLSVGTAMLILLFNGDSHLLVALFAVGAFLAFTLSQSGMVLHWLRERGQGWKVKTLINGLGALATGTALLIVGFSKFMDGAWLVIMLIPVQVVVFLRIAAHYRKVKRELSLRGLPPSLKPIKSTRVVIPVSGVHRGIVGAVNFARSISDNVTGVYVEIDPGQGDEVKEEWSAWWPDVPLVVIPSPYRSMVEPLLNYLDDTDIAHNDGQLATVVLPEFIVHRWWQVFLHNQSAWLLKTALLYRRRRNDLERIIIDVPYHLRL